MLIISIKSTSRQYLYRVLELQLIPFGVLLHVERGGVDNTKLQKSTRVKRFLKILNKFYQIL